MKGPLGLAVLLATAAAAVAATAAAVPGRIVGGESTTIDRYPGIVQIEALGVASGNWGHSCGANILTSRWVLSAAHCFAGVNYDPLRRRFRAGSTWRGEGGSIHYMIREYNHPDYGVHIQRDADITVAQTQTPFVWSPVVAPVRIVAQGSHVPDDSPVVHAGWGTLQSGASFLPPDLHHVTINTINREHCRAVYASAPGPATYPVTENMICAGILNVGGKDACQGDSGGPLYFGDDDIVVGVVSWGIGCGHEIYPGISANVASYTNWIVDTVERNS